MTEPAKSAPAQAPTWTAELERLKADQKTVRAGGGAKAQQRQHEKGRLTARERIRQLCDDGTPFDELMTFAGYGMYEDVGGCPSGGTVTGVLINPEDEENIDLMQDAELAQRPDWAVGDLVDLLIRWGVTTVLTAVG